MFIQTAALAAISLLLSALTCPMPAQAASELTTIRIAHNGFSSEIPFYVGKDAGIFVKHGFNVEPIFIVGGSTTIQALIGKSLDLLMGGATPMLSAVINGAQLKIIGGMNNRIPFALLCPTRNQNRRPTQRQKNRHHPLRQQHRLHRPAGGAGVWPEPQERHHHRANRRAGKPAARAQNQNGGCNAIQYRASRGGAKVGL